MYSSSLNSSLNDNRDTNIFANISFSFDEELIRRKFANQNSKRLAALTTSKTSKTIPIRQREKKEILSSSPQISDALQIMSQVSVSPSLFDAHYLQE